MLGREREREGCCTNTILDALTFSLLIWAREGKRRADSLIDDVKDENPVWLHPKQASEYRSHVARCLFLSPDRADITFAVNELRRRMSDPSAHCFTKLKRLVRYKKGEIMEPSV